MSGEYESGEASGYADWQMALSEVLDLEPGDLYPSDLAAALEAVLSRNQLAAVSLYIQQKKTADAMKRVKAVFEAQACGDDLPLTGREVLETRR